MDDQPTFAEITKITEPSMPGGEYRTELKTERPHECEWVDFTPNLETGLGEEPSLYPNYFPKLGPKTVTLHVRSKTKPLREIGDKVQIGWL